MSEDAKKLSLFKRLTSRKFLIAVATMLGAVGGVVKGMIDPSHALEVGKWVGIAYGIANVLDKNPDLTTLVKKVVNVVEKDVDANNK